MDQLAFGDASTPAPGGEEGGSAVVVDVTGKITVDRRDPRALGA